VRACQPWPGAYTRLQGKQLKIIEATPIERETVNPGRVAALDGGFGIETGGGLLLIEQVQLEGKRPMSGADFMRGQRQLAGTILPS
jgi:methionyl-tRNA formyltransferase